MSRVFLDGWDKFQIHDLDREDMHGILTMISSARLPERRRFNKLKTQIENTLKLWHDSNLETRGII